MVLLEVINGMTDVVFGVKDLGIVVSGAIATITAWLTLKFSFNAHKDSTKVKFDTMEKEHTKEADTLKLEITAAKMGRHAIKKELVHLVSEKFDVANLRIDKTQEDIKEHKSVVQNEFKEINSNLNKIIGMLEKK
jgi:gas vesicle protein